MVHLHGSCLPVQQKGHGARGDDIKRPAPVRTADVIFAAEFRRFEIDVVPPKGGRQAVEDMLPADGERFQREGGLQHDHGKAVMLGAAVLAAAGGGLVMIVKSRQGVSRGGSGQEIPSVAVGAAPEQIQFRITILQAAFGGGRIVPPPLRRKDRKPLPPGPGLGVPDEGDDHDHCEKNTKEKKGHGKH